MEKLLPVIVVTGSNRGLGLELVRRLASQFKNGAVYLTSRNRDAGMMAVKKLENQNLLPLYHQLDVNDSSSIDEFKHDLVKNHGAPSIDILINNAGVNLEGDKSLNLGKRAELTLETNYFGVRKVSDALFPLLNPGSRVLNMTSSVALISRRKTRNDIKERMDSNDLSLSELDSFMKDYVRCAQEGTLNENGYDDKTYGVSKYGLISLTRIQARQNLMPGVLINCCCPGWVQTDMGGKKATITLENGVETPLHCVLLPEGDEPNGKFISNRRVRKF